MKRLIYISLLAMAFAPCSFAAKPAPENDFHVAFQLGLTGGGDSIATAKYTNGDSVSIHGGGLFELGFGAYYHKPSVPVSALLTINYHVDQASAKNGNVQFDRWPLEFTGYFHINESWRIGAGLRHVMNAKLKIDKDGEASTSVEYRDANSPLVEVAWGQEWGRNNYWVGLRYVHENLKVDKVTLDGVSYGVDHTDDGSHLGVFAHYAF